MPYFGGPYAGFSVEIPWFEPTFMPYGPPPPLYGTCWWHIFFKYGGWGWSELFSTCHSCVEHPHCLSCLAWEDEQFPPPPSPITTKMVGTIGKDAGSSWPQPTWSRQSTEDRRDAPPNMTCIRKREGHLQPKGCDPAGLVQNPENTTKLRKKQIQNPPPRLGPAKKRKNDNKYKNGPKITILAFVGIFSYAWDSGVFVSCTRPAASQPKGRNSRGETRLRGPEVLGPLRGLGIRPLVSVIRDLGNPFPETP